MVICCVIGCHLKPNNESPISFYHVPTIREKHGQDSKILSTEKDAADNGSMQYEEVILLIKHYCITVDVVAILLLWNRLLGCRQKYILYFSKFDSGILDVWKPKKLVVEIKW